MNTSEMNELINQALIELQKNQAAATLTLERQLKKALSSGEFAGRIHQFNFILEAYIKEHHMDLGTLAMLAGVSKNTMTRLKKSVDSSRVETLSSILDTMGMELVIAKKAQADV